jgi:hypothetical protein
VHANHEPCLLQTPGCLFGPPISKWIAFLSRLRFASPTKAVIYRVRPFPDHVTNSYFYIHSADVAGSNAHGTVFVHVSVHLLSDLQLFSSVAVGWFFTSMSLMEGKGTSGVADSLSTVRISLLPLSFLFLTLVPRSTRRRSCGTGACY